MNTLNKQHTKNPSVELDSTDQLGAVSGEASTGVVELSAAELNQVAGGVITIEYLVLGTVIGNRSGADAVKANGANPNLDVNGQGGSDVIIGSVGLNG